MYNVVFENRNGNHKDVITWGTHESKEAFEEWYSEEIKKRYKIIANGVSRERALEICSSTEEQA
jgi:ABC-type uncharacterized transport system YnjBCD substrate-binding protein